MGSHNRPFIFRLSLVSFLSAAVLVGCGGSDEPAPGVLEEAAQGLADNVPGAGQGPVDMPGALKAPDPDQVLATVNGEAITAGRVYEMANLAKMEFLAAGQPVDEKADKRFLRASLQAEIDNRLMVQRARALEIAADPQQVEEKLQAGRSRFGSDEEYRKHLETSGVTEADLRREAEEESLMLAFVKAISPAEPPDESIAKKFYDENPKAFTKGEEVRAAQILVRSSKNDPPGKRAEAEARINEVHKKASDGADFAELAQEYSQGPTAAKGGDLGFFPRGVMVPKFEEMAFGTPTGEISPVFETPYGFNIVKVLERKEPVLKDFAEVKPMLMAELARQRDSQIFEAKLAELRASAEIEILDPEFEPVEEPATEEAAAAPAEGQGS